jgi:hypothetical protein
MTRLAALALALALALLLLAGCSGHTTGATNVTSTSATLNFVLRCDGSEKGYYYAQYHKVGSTDWASTPRQGPVQCKGPGADVPLHADVTGLDPDTGYEYRAGFEGTAGNKSWLDKNGTQKGASYDRFTTLSSGPTFHEGFDAPNCPSNAWATEDWKNPGCHPVGWNSLGLFYSVADVSSPSGTNVLEQDPARYNTMSTEQAWLHDQVTVGGSWGSKHRVDLNVKRIAWGTDALANSSWAGGPQIFMGKQSAAYGSNDYKVELDICSSTPQPCVDTGGNDGKVYVKKKTWDENWCGTTLSGGGKTFPPTGPKDPRATDCDVYNDDGNYRVASWFILASASPGSMRGGDWHHFRAVKQDNADGSVQLTGYRDGVQLVSATENTSPYDAETNPSGQAGNTPPLRGGREGWRSNGSHWHMDMFDVTVTP